MGVETHVTITFPGAGDQIKPDILAFTVERDMGQPDMAAVVLSNTNSNWSSKAKVQDDIEIKVGDDDKSIYKGQIIGLEAMYKGGEKNRLTIRAMNAMHQLLRKRKSVTFVDKKDQEIIDKVAKDAGLTLEWEYEGEAPKYKHVYQHNQTDLEFIRMRAARLGMHVWCKDTKLYVKQPKFDNSAGDLKISSTSESGEGAVKSFSPRLNSTSVVKKVTVKGWNPETKELITGDFSVQTSKLGKENASQGAGKFGKEETFTVDHPIWTPDEAKALAKGRLIDLNLSFISGECEVNGDPKYDLGQVVNIIANEEENKADDPFNGKYYITGITHRYLSTKTKDGGYSTILRLARDAQKDG